jgi:uncharacterized protein (DUF1800 family)
MCAEMSPACARFRKLCVLIVLALTGLFSLAAQAADGKSQKSHTTASGLSEHDRALHALNRITFGPRPGDIEKVLAIGVDNWLEQQLEPAKISNGVLDSKLAPYLTLQMQPRDMLLNFPNGNMITEASQGKRQLPSDPIHYGLWEILVARYKLQVQQQQQNIAAAPAAPLSPEDAAKKAAADKAAQDAAAQQAKDTAHHIALVLLNLPREKRMSSLMLLPVGDRLVFAGSLPNDDRDRLVADFSPADREVYYAMTNPTGVVVTELQQAKILRAVYSERQLEEVMTDFWFNHFNVYLNKDTDTYLVTSYERDAIRPHALGKFHDLLLATAQSPAMLYYLDNWVSMGPDSIAAGVKPGQPAKPSTTPNANPNKGLNENYARELMELHTLGVNGGYTQADVTQVARVFTGWTFQQPQQPVAPGQNPGFIFDPKRHEPGPKIVLGHTIKEGGMDEGMQVLDMLSKSPATAKFVCTKLAKRFVSDDPPPALVKEMSATFLSSDGDIREVLRTMFHSKEFWSPAIYRKKVKTPLEFVASALRATGTDVQNPGAAVQALNKMGMPLYQMAPPTGYSMAADVWMNSDALLDRLNFSLALTSGGQNGLKFDPLRVLSLGLLTRAPKEEIVPVNTAGGSDAAVALIEDALIGGETSKTTNEAIHKEINDPQISAHLSDDPGKALSTIIGLALGSPEFQLR